MNNPVTYCLPTKVVALPRNHLDTSARTTEPIPIDNFLLKQLTETLRVYGNKGLIVIGEGNSIRKNDENILDAFFKQAGFETSFVRGIQPGNPLSTLKKEARALTGLPPSWILGIGSGSVIDASKILSIWDEACPTVLNWNEPSSLSQPLLHKTKVPIVALPTCIGSGAEVSNLAELLFTSPSLRYPLVGNDLAPSIAIIDSALCNTVSTRVQSAAIVDAFSHLLDPLLNSLGRLDEDLPQVDMSVHLASRLVSLTKMPKNIQRRSSWLHELARISHFAVIPGLGRTYDESLVHRIEHILSPRFSWSHGIGVARIFPAFLEVLEERRHETWRRIAVIISRIFKKDDAPERLLRQWFEYLNIAMYSEERRNVSSNLITQEILRWFGRDGLLPGPLSFGEKEVSSVIERIFNSKSGSSPMQIAGRIHEVNEKRVFGQSIAGNWSTLIITPITSIFQRLVSCFNAKVSSGWFSTAISQNKKSVIIISITPGASNVTDALELAQQARVNFKRVLFIGLAGSLREDLPIGAWAVPREIANASSECDTIKMHRIKSDFQQVNDLIPKWLGSGPMGTQIVICASVPNLASETKGLLDFWLRIGIDVIDLEVVAIQRWCAAYTVDFDGVLVVSDHPLTGTPLWSQANLDTEVHHSLEMLSNRIFCIEE